MIKLKPSLQLYLDRHGDGLPDTLETLSDEEWEISSSYVKAMQPFVDGSKLLGGEKYPAVCAAIPLLDQVLYTHILDRSFPVIQQ